MTWLMKHPEVVYSEMEDGAVLLNLESRLYYSLDAAGLEIWRVIDSARNLDDVRRALLAKFEASDSEADACVRRFVDELRQEHLILPADSDGADTSASVPATDDPEAAPAQPGARRPLAGPALIKHDEPLHEMSQHPFDPQLPLAE